MTTLISFATSCSGIERARAPRRATGPRVATGARRREGEPHERITDGGTSYEDAAKGLSFGFRGSVNLLRRQRGAVRPLRVNVFVAGAGRGHNASSESVEDRGGPKMACGRVQETPTGPVRASEFTAVREWLGGAGACPGTVGRGPSSQVATALADGGHEGSSPPGLILALDFAIVPKSVVLVVYMFGLL